MTAGITTSVGVTTCTTTGQSAHDHQVRGPQVIRKTAALFRALGDPDRLRLLELLYDGEHCVGELAEEMDESMSVISQRLKILYQAELVSRQRQGKHIYYALADQHVVDLLANGFEHAMGDEHE